MIERRRSRNERETKYTRHVRSIDWMFLHMKRIDSAVSCFFRVLFFRLRFFCVPHSHIFIYIETVFHFFFIRHSADYLRYLRTDTHTNMNFVRRNTQQCTYAVLGAIWVYEKWSSPYALLRFACMMNNNNSRRTHKNVLHFQVQIQSECSCIIRTHIRHMPYTKCAIIQPFFNAEHLKSTHTARQTYERGHWKREANVLYTDTHTVPNARSHVILLHATIEHQSKYRFGLQKATKRTSKRITASRDWV